MRTEFVGHDRSFLDLEGAFRLSHWSFYGARRDAWQSQVLAAQTSSKLVNRPFEQRAVLQRSLATGQKLHYGYTGSMNDSTALCSEQSGHHMFEKVIV